MQMAGLNGAQKNLDDVTDVMAGGDVCYAVATTYAVAATYAVAMLLTYAVAATYAVARYADDVTDVIAGGDTSEASLNAQVTHVCSRMLTYAHVCSRMLTNAHVCSRMLYSWRRHVRSLSQRPGHSLYLLY